MIDALGGLRLCLPGRLVDPEFDGSLSNSRRRDEPLVLPSGCNDYDGLEALAYARSRKGWIEMADGSRVQQSDFERNERQQDIFHGEHQARLAYRNWYTAAAFDRRMAVRVPFMIGTSIFAAPGRAA